MRELRPFLRPQQRTRHHRASTGLRLLWLFAKAMALVMPPVLFSWWVLHFDGLRLVEVVTSGSSRVEASWIEQALVPELGSNLLTLPLSRVEDRLQAHPWTASVISRKELPGRLHVEVVDREAVAILERAEEHVFIDRQGRRIAAVPASGAEGGLPVLRLPGQRAGARGAEIEGEGALVTAALRVAELLRNEVPDWGTSLEAIEVLEDGSFRLFEAATPFPILVRLDRLGETMRAFSRVAPEIRQRFRAIEEVDLRIARRIVIRPLVLPEATAI